MRTRACVKMVLRAPYRRFGNSLQDLLTSPMGLMAVLWGRTSKPASPPDSTVPPPGGGSGTLSPSQQEPPKAGKKRLSLLSNEAGVLAILLLVLSAVWEFVKNNASLVKSQAEEQLFVSLEVRSHQPEYDLIMDWLSRQSISRTTRNISFRSTFVMDEDELPSADEDGEGLAGGAAVGKFIPGFGTHIVKYKGKRMWITRSIDDTKKHISSYRRLTDEVLRIVMFSTSRSIVEEFVRDLKKESARVRQRFTEIFIVSGSSWERLCSRPKRPLDTIFLPPSTMNTVEEIENFLKRRKFYSELGIPWRRGYLLFGPPGTGKSSFVLGVAGHFNMPVYLMSLKGGTLPDSTLLKLLNSVPVESVLVLEDLDTALPLLNGKAAPAASPRGDDDSDSNSADRCTLSGLLNALDGLASSEGRITFITANNISHFPPALLRPGRVDRQLKFEPMTNLDAASMMERYSRKYTDALLSAARGDADAQSAASAWKALQESVLRSGVDGMTAAEWQQVLMSSQHDPEMVSKELERRAARSRPHTQGGWRAPH